MKTPRDKTVAVIEEWERSFFASEFTHASGTHRHTKHPQGLLAMWLSLQDKKKFPIRYLVEADETLLQFVNPS